MLLAMLLYSPSANMEQSTSIRTLERLNHAWSITRRSGGPQEIPERRASRRTQPTRRRFYSRKPRFVNQSATEQDYVVGTTSAEEMMHLGGSLGLTLSLVGQLAGAIGRLGSQMPIDKIIIKTSKPGRHLGTLESLIISPGLCHEGMDTQSWVHQGIQDIKPIVQRILDLIKRTPQSPLQSS
jgi:hypothetical protein